MTNKKSGMGSHQSTFNIKDEWLTPPEIIHALGEFDLDPCSPINKPWETAKNYYTIQDDGLKQEWNKNYRIWLNPPYGMQTHKWIKKLSEHGNGIALIFARTETNLFFDYIWNKADGILFIKGRLSFYNVDGTKPKSNSGAPSCLIAYGQNNVEILKKSNIAGKLVELKP